MARLPLRTLRVMVYAPGSTRDVWIADELSRTDADYALARNVLEVFRALIDAPLPRPAVLVVDFDHMHPADILELHSLRERGWCGIVIGVGDVPRSLTMSLGIERIVGTESGALAAVIQNLGFTDQTIRIPVSVRGSMLIGRTR